MSDESTTESLGRRIAASRAKLGMTQQELAERLAVVSKGAVVSAAKYKFEWLVGDAALEKPLSSFWPASVTIRKSVFICAHLWLKYSQEINP